MNLDPAVILYADGEEWLLLVIQVMLVQGIQLLRGENIGYHFDAVD